MIVGKEKKPRVVKGTSLKIVLESLCCSLVDVLSSPSSASHASEDARNKDN